MHSGCSNSGRDQETEMKWNKGKEKQKEIIKTVQCGKGGHEMYETSNENWVSRMLFYSRNLCPKKCVSTTSVNPFQPYTLTRCTLWMIKVLLLGCPPLPLLESAPSCRALTAASARSAPFRMCSLMAGVLRRSASLRRCGRAPAGISAPSMNTKSTVMAPETGCVS